MTVEEFELQKTLLKKDLETNKQRITEDINHLTNEFKLGAVLKSLVDEEVKENAVKLVAIKTVDFVSELAKDKIQDAEFENENSRKIFQFLADIFPNIIKQVIARYGEEEEEEQAPK